MSTKPNPELIDDQNPEWTEEMFAQAKRISDLPALLQAKLGGRGLQKTPTDAALNKDSATLPLRPRHIKR